MRGLKQFAVVGLAALMVLGVVPAASAAPVTFTDSNGIGYAADNGNVAAGATVTDYSGASTDVTIPETVDISGTTYDVTGIGNWSMFNGSLTSVVIPNSVTSIGEYAFASNILTSVTLPNGVTNIDSYAFADNILTSATILNGVTRIGVGAFLINRLTSVTIPESVTTIENGAFASNNLTSVQFLGAVPTTVGDSVFDGPAEMVVRYLPQYGSPTVPGGYTTPTWAPTGTADVYNTTTEFAVTYETGGGSTAPPPVTVTSGTATTAPADPTWTGHTFTGWFTAATGGSAWNFTSPVTADTTLYAHWVTYGPVTLTLDGISYGADSRDIEAGATVTDYTGGPTVSIPATVSIQGTEYTVTSIGQDAFYDAGLTSVTIPDTVTSIGQDAFNSNSLTSVIIPDSVNSIGAYAFMSNNLTSVAIPNSVTSIGGYAFDDNSLTSVTIPDGVTSIDEGAFHGNSLTSVTIPNSVTSIGGYAFDANNLAAVHFLGAAPTTVGPSAFGTDDGLLVSYLPQYGSSVVAGGFTFPTWTPAGTSDVYATYALANVAFDTTGGSTAPAPVAVNSAGTVTRPADPTWAGHTFTGWFTAATGGTAWGFTGRVGADITLYAQWATVTPPVVIPPLVDDPADTTPVVNLTVDLKVGSPIGNAPVDISGAGLLANSPWSLVLHSTPTTVASGTANSSGAFTGTFSLPAIIPAGAHTLTLTGTAPDGSAVTRVVYLTVTDAGTLDYLSTQGPQFLAATGVDTPVDGLASGAFILLILGTVLIRARRLRRAVR